ncbi:MAG: benzoyl-CoA 2,3-epoxidase subunit BoxB, partial [Acidimicrobiia bacterium]
DDFIDDCQGGVTRWNRAIAGYGIEFEIRLPHVAFNRLIGEFTDIDVSPTGEILTRDDWKANRDGWLPTSDDKTFIEGLMQPEFRPGRFASWIAPPTKGIQNMPEEFLYVRLP